MAMYQILNVIYKGNVVWHPYIFMSYCESDLPENQTAKTVDPRSIYKDLVQAGYKWYLTIQIHARFQHTKLLKDMPYH